MVTPPVPGAPTADTDDAEREAADAPDPREAWLSVALADLDGCAAALATAARHGRPLPARRPRADPADA